MTTTQRLFQTARRLLPHGRRSLIAAAAASTAVIAPMAAWKLSESSPSSDDDGLRAGLLRRWPTALCEPDSPQDKRGFAQLMRDYELSGKQLGDGAYSVVYRGKCRKTGEAVAIKMVPKALDDDAADYKRVQADDEVRREVEMLKRVSMHSCISKFQAYYESKTHHYIVSELVTGGELFDHLAEIGSYSEKQAAALLQELGGAVALTDARAGPAFPFLVYIYGFIYGFTSLTCYCKQ